MSPKGGGGKRSSAFSLVGEPYTQQGAVSQGVQASMGFLGPSSLVH